MMERDCELTDKYMVVSTGRKPMGSLSDKFSVNKINKLQLKKDFQQNLNRLYSSEGKDERCKWLFIFFSKVKQNWNIELE